MSPNDKSYRSSCLFVDVASSPPTQYYARPQRHRVLTIIYHTYMYVYYICNEYAAYALCNSMRKQLRPVYIFIYVIVMARLVHKSHFILRGTWFRMGAKVYTQRLHGYRQLASRRTSIFEQHTNVKLADMSFVHYLCCKTLRIFNYIKH